MKYFKLLGLIIYSASCFSQISINAIDHKAVLLNYNEIGPLHSLKSTEDSCSYLYAQISHITNEDGKPINVGGKIYTPKKHKYLLWMAKLNSKGDTLSTKILPDVPEFSMILAASVKKSILYFLLSNTYVEGERNRNGCLFVSYNPITGKFLCQQVYADLYDSDSFFIKDNYRFYLLVNDVPHHCVPPEYYIQLLELDNSGKVISRKLLSKTICQRGEYSPRVVYVSKVKKQFYLIDADFFKEKTIIKNSCNLNLFDVYENTAILYNSYKRHLSSFSLKSLHKIRKVSFPCDQRLISFLNDTDYVSVYNNTAKSRITFIFTDLKKRSKKELEIKTFDWHSTKLVGENIFVLGFSGDTVNIKRIRNKTLVTNNDYIMTNYKAQYGNDITPMVLKDRVRFFYTRDASDSKQEISYFDEMNIP